MTEEKFTDVHEDLKTQPVWSESYEVAQSSEIGKLVLALCKAQLQFKPVLKQTDNAAFMRGGKASKYADLAAYIDATQEALAKEELVVMQWPDVSPGAKSMSLVSILAHSSGQWIRGKLTLPAIGRDGFTAQSCGSSITYARRYSYAAITGCASEDDDGNAASGRGTAEAAQAVGQQKLKDMQAAKRAKEQGNGADLTQPLQESLAAAKSNGNKAVQIKHPEEHHPFYFTVHGSKLDEDKMITFLRDVNASYKKNAKDGSTYWRVPADYETSFRELCDKLKIEVTE
jgi:hypothetical protein